jgi:uncharacterized protein (TIGR03067 family)
LGCEPVEDLAEEHRRSSVSGRTTVATNRLRPPTPCTQGWDEKTYRGIYAIEGDVLKICFDKGGTKRPAEFKAANAGEVLLVLKRK